MTLLHRRAKEYAAAMKEAASASVPTLDRQDTSSTLDPHSSGAQKQSAALRQAGLDQKGVPFAAAPGIDGGNLAFTSISNQSRPKKISFKDSIKRTFGRRMSGTTEGNFQISAPAALMNDGISAGRKAEEFYTPLERPGVRVAPPTPGAGEAGSGLPSIPIDPRLNRKDAEAQNRRLLALKDHVKLGNEGTYGRSASMDVPRPSSSNNPKVGFGSETNLVRTESRTAGGGAGKGFMGLVRGASGYGSDPDAAAVTSPSKGGFSIPGFGPGKSMSGGGGGARPPVSAARFGGGNIGAGAGAGAGGADNAGGGTSRGRKWSLGRSASTPTSGGFFQHRE